jgi:hypothetical protein
MNETNNSDEVMTFFKALANIERLKIIGLLAIGPHTIEQASTALHMQVKTVTHCLTYLVGICLVKYIDGTYLLDNEALEAMSRRVLSGSRPHKSPDEFEGEAFDRKVLSDYIAADGRVKAFPTQQKKMLIVLRHILPVIKPGVIYSEKQINELLQQFNEDTAYIRRSMIDLGWLAREVSGGKYWLVEQKVS